MINANSNDFISNNKILDKAEVIARTVISQQSFYLSKDCNNNHRQLLETMIGAAIWYLPQGKDLWTGDISVDALKELSKSNTPDKVTLTKDHHFPRKVAAGELLKLDWSHFLNPSEEVLKRYKNRYGRFNYVLPEENKRLVKYQKGVNFVSPEDSYQKAGIILRNLSHEQLNIIRKGDRQLAELAISNQINS
tara:strand:+ start:321 stop:896 length:576 start_codon:yes stop_codon:yes gene_type:complete